MLDEFWEKFWINIDPKFQIHNQQSYKSWFESFRSLILSQDIKKTTISTILTENSGLLKHVVVKIPSKLIPNNTYTKLEFEELKDPIITKVNFLDNFFKLEDNEKLWKLNSIIRNHGKAGLVYSKISKLFSKTYGKRDKIDSQNVSHYSKKLEKHRFVICTTLQQNSERKIFPREEYVQRYYDVVMNFYPKLNYLDAPKYK